MRVVDLIAALQQIVDQGDGDAVVLIEEEGLGYAGTLADVDTVLPMGGRKTLALLAEPSGTRPTATPVHAPPPTPERNPEMAKSGPNHVVHAILSILTSGLWLPVWLIIALRNKG